MIKVKMFKSVKNMPVIEFQINEFIESNNIYVIDIKYDHIECLGHIYYTAMVIYEI